MTKAKTVGKAASGVLVVPVVLVIALVGSSPLWAVPMIASLWMFVLKEKGYLNIAAPLFFATSVIFAVSPGPATGAVAILPLILLSGLLPARRRGLDGRWRLASKDGTLKNWFLPAGPNEDIGAITGDASIHLIIVGVAIIIIGCLQAGTF
jgi:hypothetical protein